jgi:NADH:ubiquinone oxidoreductase subunit 6 (subunit J)
VNAADFAFGSSVLLTVGGALLVVLGRRTPVVNAVGLVIAMAGVALACGIAGAPLIGLLQLLVSGGVAVVLVLVTLSLVGTGRTTLPRLSLGGLILRTVSAGLVAGLIGSLIIHVLPAVPPGVAIPDGVADIHALGRGLFGHDVIVVTAAGFILLVAILGSVALVARSPE